MADTVKISIAIPAYAKDNNGISYLKDALESIKNQTFQDYEVVISDHSPSNILLEICEEYSKKIKIVYIKNF